MDLRRRLIPDMIMLQSFDSAARHLNFTRAAEELHLTQSSISRHVQDLEAQLGVALFNRVRRQVVLTPAGLQFQREAARLLQDSRTMMMRALHTGDSPEVLRIATLPTFAGRWLVPRLPRFCADHPGLQIDVITYDAPFPLAREHCDLAFHFGDPVWPQGECRYLCSEQVVAVCAPQLLPDPAEPVETVLARLPLLQNAGRPLQWQDWLTQAGIERDFSLRGPRFDSFATTIAAAQAGLGVALLPDYLIETELATGELLLLDAPALVSTAAYYIAMPDQSPRGQLAQAFADWACAQVRKR